MRAQGEKRGEEKPRIGGGDWDVNVNDIIVAKPIEQGERCKALKVRDYSLVEGEPYPSELEGAIGMLCSNIAPKGASICTPCWRRRIRIHFRRLSLEHRTRIAHQTGKPLEEIQ